MTLEVSISPEPVKRGSKASVTVVIVGDAALVKTVDMSYPLAGINISLPKLGYDTYGGEQVIPKIIPPGQYDMIFTAKDEYGKRVAGSVERVEIN